MEDGKLAIKNRSESVGTAVGINPRRAHFNAGTAKNSSGASFAQDFRAWWFTQKVFRRQQDLAREIGVAIETLQQWLMGRAFPTDPFCDLLHSVTGLACFSKG